MVDPCIAVALIAVRENHVPYHSNCQAFPHSGDVEGIRLLRSLYPVSHTPAEDVEDPNSARAESDLRIEELEYSDIGKLIHPELLHINPSVASKQANLVRHVMRHFLPDELSAALFDALPNDTQARLARALLTASQWMSPHACEHWAKTGHNVA